MLADGRTVRARQFVASTLDVHQTFETLIGRDQLPEAFRRKLDGFQYTAWTLYGLHLALHESPRFSAAAFDPNINRALKWSIGAETMEDLFDGAPATCRPAACRSSIQFGSGPLSLLDPDPGAARQAHDLCLARDAARSGHRAAQDIDELREEFADKIIETFARYCPNMTRHEHHRPATSIRARHYARELINMRNGDIFMGAFNAEQVMYNHFGYRTPIANLYKAGSAGHPGGAISGGAGYITAGIIARDLGLKPWWKPWSAREALEAMPAAA